MVTHPCIFFSYDSAFAATSLLSANGLSAQNIPLEAATVDLIVL
jgi:hypothetical protein